MCIYTIINAEFKKSFVEEIKKNEPFVFKEYKKKGLIKGLGKVKFDFYIQEKVLSSDEKDFKKYAQDQGCEIAGEPGNFKIMSKIRK